MRALIAERCDTAGLSGSGAAQSGRGLDEDWLGDHAHADGGVGDGQCFVEPASACAVENGLERTRGTSVRGFWGQVSVVDLGVRRDFDSLGARHGDVCDLGLVQHAEFPDLGRGDV